MVDRLEELLAQMADEDDEEQEDALALEAGRAAPAAPAPGSENQPERHPDLGHPEGTEQEEREGASAPAANGELWATVLRVGGEHPPEDGRPASAHENGLTPTRALRAGDSRAAEGLRTARLAAAEDAGAAAEDAGAATTPGASAERGLEALYRRTAQAGRPAVQSLPVEQAGRMRHAEEPGRAAALTVDELDRAVRRDSRRYDGGMSIF